MVNAFIEKWTRYRDTRVGDYAFRSRTRYKAVADRLFKMGLSDEHSVLDVGAGTCQFGQYLEERGWHGTYKGVDAVIDGTNLEFCTLPKADFIVCIETVEHLNNPCGLIDKMMCSAWMGFIVTTPNAEAVDVINCDPTHRSVVPARVFNVFWKMTVERHSWFGVPNDSLLAWRQYD